MKKTAALTPAQIKENQITTWFESIAKDDIKAMQELLDSGFNINTRDENKNTALILAVFRNQLNIVQMLLDNKCNLNLKCNSSYYYSNDMGLNALGTAASLGHLEAIEMLVKAGASLENEESKKKRSPESPLYQAIWAGNESAIILLIELGAEFDIKKVKKTVSDNNMEKEYSEETINKFQIVYAKTQLETALNKSSPLKQNSKSAIKKYKI